MTPLIKLMALGKSTGGTPDMKLEALSVTKNGIYKAPLKTAYSSVTVRTEEITDEEKKIVIISGLQSTIPLFSDGTVFSGKIDSTIFRNSFGESLVLNFPNAVYVGGGPSFMPYTRTEDTLQTPDTVTLNIKDEPINFGLYFYGSSAGLGTLIFRNGIKTFRIRCGESDIVKVKTVGANAFRNNITTAIDCVFDWSLITSGVSGFFGTALEYLRFKADSLGCNCNLSDCFSLSDESILSVANSLVCSSNVRTLTLHQSVKERCSFIRVRYSEITEDGKSFLFAVPDNENDEGTVSLTYFITQIKGWTIA